MTHDACDWCGTTWGEDGEESVPAAPVAPEPAADEMIDLAPLVATAARALDRAQGNRYGDQAEEEWRAEARAVVFALLPHFRAIIAAPPAPVAEPAETREALAAAFMHHGTFRDLQANDDWGYAAADIALTVLAALPAPAVTGCPMCEHAPHGDTDCGEVTGYDHLNGDHKCGCPGRTSKQEARARHEWASFVHAIDTSDDLTEYDEGRYVGLLVGMAAVDALAAERDSLRRSLADAEAKVAAVTALRALSDAATPGPWRQEPNTFAGQVWVSMDHRSDLEPGTREADWRRLFRVRSHRDNYGRLSQEEVFAQREADAAFIAAAVNAVRAALAAPGTDDGSLP